MSKKKDMLGTEPRLARLQDLLGFLVDLREDRIGALCDLLEKLSGKNGELWFTMFRRFLRKELHLTDDELEKLYTALGGPEVVQKILAGHTRVKVEETKHIIDCSKLPSCPEGWQILPDSEQLQNRFTGKLTWDPTKVLLHLDQGQKDGKVIRGHELKKELAKLPCHTILPVHVGYYLLKHQALIPEEWKGKAICFWGTIHRYSDGRLCVYCLYWYGGGWDWGYYWLDYDFADSLAVVSQV